MKILHIANFAYNYQGGSFYNCDYKFSAGFIRRGHYVYEYSLRDMARTATIFRTKKLGASMASQEVLALCRNIEPDLLLLGHVQIFKPEILKQIRQEFPNMRIAFWYVDPLYMPEKLTYIQEFAPCLDAVFATTGGDWLRNMVKGSMVKAYIPNPVDRAVESLRNFEKRDFSHELIFCGTIGEGVERRNFMETLQNRLQDLPLALHGLLGHEKINGVRYTRALSNTRMGLNYSRRNDITFYSSDRVAQLTGNGLLTFSPRVPGFEALYNDQELAYFDSVDELIDKTRYYHQHPDEAAVLAERGWRRSHQSCNAERVAKFMEETIFELPYSEHYEWRDHIFK